MKRRALFALVPVALAVAGATVWPATASSAGSPSVQIRSVNAEAYPNVAVTTSVTAGTDPKDIVLKENGLAVEILSVRPLIETGDEIDVVLALDTSDSVHGAPLQAAVAAAQAFVSSLPSAVPVGLITFSDQVRVLNPITTDHSAVLQALAHVSDTQKGTALYDAISLAAGLVSGTAQHNLILLTDGTDFGSTHDIASAEDAATGARMAVFSFGLQGHATNFPALEQISHDTGGAFLPATTADLSQLYTDLSAKLARQYVVLYRSTSPAGVQVSITVETPIGSDTSFVLIPRAVPPPVPGRAPSRWNFSGTEALVSTLALCFAALFLLLVMSMGARGRASRDRELARRMSLSQSGIESSDPTVRPDHPIWIPEPVVAVAQRLAEVSGISASLDRKLERAGLPVRPGEILAGSALAAMFGALLGGILLRSAIFAPVFAVPAAAVPFLWLNRRVTKRINRLDAQLPDVLMILASSLRAGHSFLQALDSVAKEIGDPASPEFTRVVAEIRLGRKFEDAMNGMAERIGTEEFKWAVMAVNVQHEVGGNLAEILDILAETVRERQVVRRQVKVLAAEGVLSMRILTVLPFLLVAYIVKVNPSYMRLLWTTRLGWVMIAAASILMAIGTLWARRVVKIDV
jgi:tight adherence protein B